MIRTLVIENNRLLRESLVAIINSQRDVKAIAVSEGNENAILNARTTKPHVVLIDLGLRSSGLKIVESLINRDGPKVIGMGLTATQKDIGHFVQVGVSGFILANAPVDDILATIRSVAKGGKVLPSALSDSLFCHVMGNANNRGEDSSHNNVGLTKREREIVVLIAEGLSNKEIASRLNIARDTVKSHVRNVLAKFELKTRLQLAAANHKAHLLIARHKRE